MTSSEKRISNPWSRLGITLLYGIGQIRTVKKIYPGIMHLLIFWGVLIQVVGTAIKIMQMGLFVPFTWPLFSEPVYFVYELIEVTVFFRVQSLVNAFQLFAITEVSVNCLTKVFSYHLFIAFWPEPLSSRICIFSIWYKMHILSPVCCLLGKRFRL